MSDQREAAAGWRESGDIVPISGVGGNGKSALPTNAYYVPGFYVVDIRGLAQRAAGQELSMLSSELPEFPEFMAHAAHCRRPFGYVTAAAGAG